MRTLVIIKPDAVASGYLEKIIQHLKDAGLKLIGYKSHFLTRQEVENFYAEHVGKPFFEAHAEFMTSGVCVAAIFECEQTDLVRELVGATDPAQAGSGTIRALYGTDLPRNAVHTSDSPEAAERELNFFFGEQS